MPPCPARSRVGPVLGLFAILGSLLAGVGAAAEAGTPIRLEIEPGQTILVGHGATAQLIASGHYADGSIRDLTREVAWASADPEIVDVGAGGQVEARGDGRARLSARLGAIEAAIEVTTRDAGRVLPIEFEHQVLPALTRAGCNQGACHGTPSGKNGFRLSLRGYDPALDFQTLTRESGSRRANPIEPESSLILLKGNATIPHEGGRRLASGSLLERTLRDWIAGGLRPEPEGAPGPLALEISPGARVLDEPARDQQLVVRARFEDQTSRDVTGLACFDSSDPAVARVDDSGIVHRVGRGEATILVRFEHLIATATLTFRMPVPGLEWSDPPVNNFIDRHVFAKLKLLRIPPSPLADDATFCRRVFLDAIGLPPTPAEIRAFVDDPRPDRRARLIDDLLQRPEYADFWALKWSDRLGCNQRFTGHKGAYSYHRWIRDQVAANVPFDRFVRAIVTAKGGNYSTPPASFWRRLRSPEDAAESVGQTFLGIRIQCARCHNHPAERWTQDDYYGFAAFFSQLRFKDGPQFFAMYDKEETVYTAPTAEVIHPRTGATMPPKPPGGPVAKTVKGRDRRADLADWLVAPANPFFARAAVNRIWYHLMGRGIVEPVDDLRTSNPPASEELLAALTRDFIDHGFDCRRTIGLILKSRTYQLASSANAFNAGDDRYFSHALVRRLSAEQLLDAASAATGAPEKLFHLPPGTHASEVPDGEFDHPFLRRFGQPPRAVACECERGTDSTLEQALQLVSGRTIHAKLVKPDNRIGRLLKAGADDRTIIEELYLASLGRSPDASEQALALAYLSARPDARRGAIEDLLWSLLNHPEFLFQH